MRAACSILVSLLAGLLIGAGAEPEIDKPVSLSFRDVTSSVLFETLSNILDHAPVIGEPPDCRIDLELAPLSLQDIMNRLNQVYGIAFVEVDGGYQIFVPEDTERLCTIALVGG